MGEEAEYEAGLRYDLMAARSEFVRKYGGYPDIIYLTASDLKVLEDGAKRCFQFEAISGSPQAFGCTVIVDRRENAYAIDGGPVESVASLLANGPGRKGK